MQCAIFTYFLPFKMTCLNAFKYLCIFKYKSKSKHKTKDISQSGINKVT